MPILAVGGQDYELGMSVTGSGKVVVVALPMPQGLSKTAIRIRSGAASYWQLFRLRNRVRSNFFLLLLLVTVFVFFSSVWLAMFLSKQITRPVSALADAMDADRGGQIRTARGVDHHRRNGRPGALVQPHGGRSRDQPAVGGNVFGAADRGQPGH